jgi:D-alanyl-D-alanine carboxypeptidase (penicillin-binding protein 5/6)
VLLGLGMSRLAASPPRPTVQLDLPAPARGTTIPALPWPATGQAAVAVPGTGLFLTSGPERPVPVASLTKIMTALVVLHDHPLRPGQAGPLVTITPTDVADAARLEAEDATVLPIQVGERLSERQLLAGLLVRSANDFADALARWDAGSLAAFVDRMDHTAQALGLRQTSYADPSGVSDRSRSTAADQLRLAEIAMENPVFAQLVAQPSVVEPLAGQVANYVSAVGHDGVVGVKSGFTQAAMGCLVLAARRPVDGRSVLLLAAVTGQGGFNPLGLAQQVDLRLVDRLAQSLRVVTLLRRGTVLGTVRTPWLGTLPASVVADRTVTLLVGPGQQPRWSSALRPLRAPTRRGAVVGQVTFQLGSQRVGAPLVTARALPPPGLWWLLAH